MLASPTTKNFPVPTINLNRQQPLHRGPTNNVEANRPYSLAVVSFI